MADNSPPQVSVIIPVYNDPRLTLCLTALREQRFSRSFEVIVVDNGSGMGSSDQCRRFPEVRFIEEPQPGSYAARNAGVHTARGTVLAFTDSDCIPEPEWLSAGYQALEEGNADLGVITGPIRLCYQNPNRLTPAELYEKRFAFAQNIRTEPDYVPTANWFSYRSVIVDAGLFNSSLRSGGDLELSRRLAAEGYRLLGVSRAVVLHPARARISELLHKEARTFGGKVTQAGGKRTTRVILRSAKQRMTKHAARLGDVLRNRGLFATKRERSWCAVITVFILLVVGLEAVRLLFGGAAKR